MRAEIGDTITVFLDGKPYETYIDEHGTQRFRIDPTHLLWDRWSGMDHIGNGRGKEDLNDLAIAYGGGEFDQRTYAEFNMSIGYSVSGFCELSCFEDMRLVNPLWGQKEEDIPDDTYLFALLRKYEISLSEMISLIMEREGLEHSEAERYFVENFIG